MANNTRKRIQYDVGFNTDTKQLDEVKKQLQEISKLTNTKFKQNGIFSTDEMQKIRSVATEVSNAINKAYNPKINSVNITKFNAELAKSNLTVKQIYDNFNKVGTTGQNAFRNLQTSLLTTNKELKQTHTFLDNIATTLSNTIKWNAASGAVNTLTAKISGAVSYIERLDSSLNDIRIVTGQSADEMDKFAVKANKAAENLGKSTLDYTKAALTYYQQGLSDDEVAARTEVTMKASNVTGQSTDDVAEQLTAVWNGFKVAAEDTEEYVDKLAAVGAATASDLEELSSGMAKVASGAASMGVNIDQLTASLATIVSTTRQDASSVGTALKTIYSRIADIKAGADDAETTLGNYSSKMAELGFNVLDSEGKMRDLGVVMEEIGNNWKNLSREQQIYLAQTMAGTRQYNNLIALFDNWEEYQSALNVSQKAAGTLQKQQNVYLESTTAHINELNTAWDSLYHSTLDADTINTVTDGLKVLVKLTDNWIQSIGGGKGVLLNLGAIATNVFSKQIASSIAISINNLKSERQEIEEIQARLKLTDEVRNNKTYDEESRAIAQMANDSIKYTSVMSQSQQEYSNSLIETQTQLLNQKAAYDKASASAVEYLKNHQSTQNLGLDNNDQHLETSKKLEDQLEDLNVQLVEEAENYSRLKAILKDTDLAYDDELQNTKTMGAAYVENKKTVQAFLETYQALQNEMRTNADSFKQGDAALFASRDNEWQAELNKAIQRHKDDIGFQSLDGTDQSQLAYLLTVDDQLQAVFNDASGSFSRMVGEMANEANTAAAAVSNAATGAGDVLNTKISENKAKFDELVKTISNPKNIQGIIQIAGGMTSFAATVSNAKNAWEVLNDKTLTGTEKITQRITSVGTALSGVVMGVNNLSKGLSVLGLSSKAAMGVAIAVMAAGAIIGVVTQAIEEHNKAAEKAREKIANSSKEFEEATSNLKTYNDELKTNKERLEELAKIKSADLTNSQKEEITNLQAQNALLETQIALEERKRQAAMDDTIDQYEEDSANGVYSKDSTFKTQAADYAHSATLDLNDPNAWTNYATKVQGDAATLDEDQQQLMLTNLEKDRQLFIKAQQDYTQFYSDNFETLQQVVAAYIAKGKEIPESLNEDMKKSMEVAGTYETTANSLVQQIVGDNESLWDDLTEKAKEKGSDQTWEQILPASTFKQFNDIIKDTGLSVEDVLTTALGDGTQSFDAFNNKVQESIEKLKIGTTVTDENVTALSELISKIQTKGTDSLTDKELTSLESLETQLGKVSIKYATLATLRKTNEQEYIKLLKEGREELRQQTIQESAQKITEGRSAAAHGNTSFTSGNNKGQQQVTVGVNFDDKDFRADMDELLNEKYELNIQVNTDMQESTNEILDSYDVLQKAFNKIDKNLKMSGESVVDLMQTFPQLADSLLANSKRASDGSIQFTKAGFEAFKTAAMQEIAADSQVTKQKIENQITEYDAEIEKTENAIAALDTYIDACEQSGTDETDLKQAANEAIDELNTQMYNNAVELATQSDNQILDNNKEMLDQVAEDLGLSLEDQAALWNSYAKDVTKNLEEISRGQQAIANNEAYTPNLSAINPSNYHKKSKTSGGNLTSEEITSDGIDDAALTKVNDIVSARATRDKLETYLTSLKAGKATLVGLIAQIDTADVALGDFQGKGGSSKKDGTTAAHIADIIDKLEDELDAYHNINIEIQQLENEYSKLQDLAKELYGNDLIKNYDKQLDNLNKQLDKQKEKLQINKKVVADTKAVVEAYNSTDVSDNPLTAIFDEDGQITNYNELLDALQTKINTKTDEYNALNYSGQQTESGKTLKQEIEQLTKDRELLKTHMDAYNTALNEDQQNILDQMQKVHEEILEINQAMIDFKSPKLSDYIEDIHLLTDTLNDLSSALNGIESLISNSEIDTYASAWSEFGLDILETAGKLSETYDSFVKIQDSAINLKQIFSQSKTNFKGIAGKWTEQRNNLQSQITAAQEKQAAGKTLSQDELDLLDTGSEQINLYNQNLNLLDTLSQRLDQIGQNFNLKDPKTWFNTVKDLSSYLKDFKGTITDLLNSGASVNIGAVEDLSGVLNGLSSELSTTLGSITAGISLGVSVVSTIITALDNLTSAIQKVHVRMANEKAELANTEFDSMSQWMEFRKSLEILTGNKSLGKLKQSIQDLTDLLQEFGGGSSLDGVKTTIDTFGTLKSRVDSLNQSISDGSYKNTYATFWKDGLSQALSDLKKYTDDLMNQTEQVQEILENWSSEFVNAWSYIGDQMNKQVKRYETITDEIEHKKNMMTLLYGDEAYEELESWYDLQNQVNQGQLNFEKQQVDYWKQRMSELEEGSEAWEEAESQWQSALSSFNSTLENAIQNIIDKYSNAVNKIFANMTNQLTNGAGLSWLQTEMNLMNKYSDHYLDGINSIYQITSLQNKFMNAINNAEGNVTAQERIKKLMDEQLADLKSRDKLTKYDVERAEKLLDIETARQALKDAQNNNSKMRLTRDSQGNYSYSYVADEDAINEAEQKLADAQNSLYNFDKDQYSQNLSDMYSIYEEYMNKMKEIATNQNLDEKERQRQLTELTQKYQEYITGLTQDNEQIRSNLADSTFQNYFANQEIARDTTSSNYQEFMDYCEKAGLSFDATTGKMTTDISSLSEESKNKLKDFGLAFDEQTNALKVNWKGMTDSNKLDFSNCINTNVTLWDSAMQSMINKINTDENSFKNMSVKALDEIKQAQINYNKEVEATKAAIGGIDFTKVNEGSTTWKSYMDSINTSSGQIASKYQQQATELINLNEKAKLYKEQWDQILADIKESVKQSQQIQTSQANNATKDDIKGSTTKVTTAVGTTGGAAAGAAIGGAIGGPVGALAGGLLGAGLGALGGFLFGRFDTGGYTGNWTDSAADKKNGKLAILHEKELVLNAEDTKNILAAVDTVRSISDSLRGQALETANSYTSDLDTTAPIVTQPITQSVQQDVHIDATFPNVTDHNEIELAMNNLMNTASQKVMEKNIDNVNIGKLST